MDRASVASRGKFQRRAERCAAQPVIDVVGRLFFVERRQMITDRDPLAQLFELRRRELVAQVRLADQDDLQQLRFLRFEIREHAEFLERGEAQVLRLVDHEQHHASGKPLIDEILREIPQQQRFAAAGGSRPKSIMIVSSSSRGSSIVFTMRPTVVCVSRFRSTV